MHVFAYGTLMFPEVWQVVVGRAFEQCEARLSGYRIFGVRGEVYPGIVAGRPADEVLGLVYFDVDERSVQRLDRFEGSMYERLALTVCSETGASIVAGAYIVRPEYADQLTPEPWYAAEFAARGQLAEFMARYAGFNRYADDDSR